MGEFTVSTYQFKAAIRRLLSEFPDIRHKAMVEAAQTMRREAQLRCPVDEGNLTNDIAADTEIYPKSEQACVYVPVNAPSSKYAIPMHEHDYELGENSKIKQGKVSVVVGKGYLTRAITENIKSIMGGIAHTLRTELEKRA